MVKLLVCGTVAAAVGQYGFVGCVSHRSVNCVWSALSPSSQLWFREAAQLRVLR